MISRLKPILNQLPVKEFRDSYVSSHTKTFLAAQMKNLRGRRTQKEFAKILNTTQSVISRYEDPDYGQVTLQTLLDTASKLDVALIVRFSSFPDFFRVTSDYSSSTQEPDSFKHAELTELCFSIENSQLLSTLGNEFASNQMRVINNIPIQRPSINYCKSDSSEQAYSQPAYNCGIQNQSKDPWRATCN